MRRFAAVVSAAALAWGCSDPPDVLAVNRTGAVIEVAQRLPGWSNDVRWVKVGPGESLFVEHLEPGRLVRVRRDGCVYAYQPPKLWKWLKNLDAPDYYGPTTQVRLEPDMTVSLLPWTVSSVSPDAAALRRSGFPISPVSKTCPEAGAGA
jgi:hypothetical protein